MSVGLLRRLEPAQDAARIVERAGRHQRARGLDQIARPDEVIAAEILVAARETPRDRQAGDDAARERLRLVGAQHRRADAIGARPAIVARRIERHQPRLPVMPRLGEIGERGIEAVGKAGDDAIGGLFGLPAEAQGDVERAIAGRKIDLGGQRDIAAARRIVVPGQREML